MKVYLVIDYQKKNKLVQSTLGLLQISLRSLITATLFNEGKK